MRQNKDVNAQYEVIVLNQAIIALSKMPTQTTGGLLAAYMKDTNLFYRLRMEAAIALSKFDTAELDYFGLNQLLKYLKENYCLDDSDSFIPKVNNFEDMQEYYIRNSILTALSLFRDNRGWTPSQCRQILIEFLKWNDNTTNRCSDSIVLAILIDCIGNTFLQRPKNASDLAWSLAERIHYKETRAIRNEDVEEFEFPTVEEEWSHHNSETVKNFFSPEDHVLLEAALNEVSKYMVRDRFSPSFQNAVTVACLEVYVIHVATY
jgi:transcription initiation factor TFIID subunit 2